MTPDQLRDLELAAHRAEVAARHLRELAADVRRSPTGMSAEEIPAARAALVQALERLR